MPGTLAEDQIGEDRGAHRLCEQRDRHDRGLELPQQVVDHRVPEELRSDRHRDEQRPHLRGVPEERRARRQHRDPEERRRNPVDRRRIRHQGQLGAHMPPDHDVDGGEDRAGDGEQVAQGGVRATGGAARGRDDHAAGDRHRDPDPAAARGALPDEQSRRSPPRSASTGPVQCSRRRSCTTTTRSTSRSAGRAPPRSATSSQR